MNYNKENSFYICYCCLHITFLKSDLDKHLHRKEPCEAKYNCLLSRDEIIKKSLYNRFYLLDTIKIKDLEKYHLIMLVTQYNNKLNVISNINEINKKNIINPSNSTIIDSLDNKIKNIENMKDINDCIIIFNGQKRYKCFECNTIYKRKENLIEHFNNIELCNKKKEQNKLFEMKKINAITNELQNKTFIKSQSVINNINQNNINQNNIIQNNNIQNNNNLSNNYSVGLKDFIEDNYNYSHIPLNAIQNNDFYLYKNFLNLILENDENKNIYFDGKYAFVYSDGRLKRIQGEKAGYLVLEKLDKAIISYVYSNPQSLKEDYSYVDRYYSVMKNKYVFDTIHKPYNIETKKFDYCETKNIRTRDNCLSEITHICNLHKEKTKQIFKDKECDKYEIDTSYQVNIPNYESIRCRNKGFIDNGKYY